MESNLNKSTSPIPTEDTTNSSGADNSEQRISELSGALDVVKDKFVKHGNKLKTQSILWGVACILILISCFFLGKTLLHEAFPENWTWQIAYISVIRITIAGAIFSISSFCIKIFRSYIHLNEQNSHSITVIESMANLVGAAKDQQQRNIIYTKLIDIIIHFGQPGFLHSDPEINSLAKTSIDSIQKILTKKD